MQNLSHLQHTDGTNLSLGVAMFRSEPQSGAPLATLAERIAARYVKREEYDYLLRDVGSLRQRVAWLEQRLSSVASEYHTLAAQLTVSALQVRPPFYLRIWHRVRNIMRGLWGS